MVAHEPLAILPRYRFWVFPWLVCCKFVSSHSRTQPAVLAAERPLPHGRNWSARATWVRLLESAARRCGSLFPRFVPTSDAFRRGGVGCAVRLNEDQPVALAAFLQCLELAHMSVQFCAADFGVSDCPWSVQVSLHKCC